MNQVAVRGMKGLSTKENLQETLVCWPLKIMRAIYKGHRDVEEQLGGTSIVLNIFVPYYKVRIWIENAPRQ